MVAEFAVSMDNSSGPFLLPALLLLQNSSSPKGSSPAAGSELAEPAGPGWARNLSEPQAGLRPGEMAAAGALWAALWLISVPGNLLVCLVIHSRRTTWAARPWCCLGKLAWGRWVLGSGVCRLVRYLHYLTPGVQTYVLLSIGVDRFYTIVYPLSFKVSRGKAKKMILASWLCGALFASPACFLYGSSSEHHCNFFLPDSWQGAAYGITHLLLVFLIPALLIILFYQKVVKYIWRIGTDGMTVRRTTNIVPRTKVKTIKMFLMLNSIFLLSWLPFFTAQLWHPQETDYRKSSLLFLAVTWISFSSSASKPTLYSIYNANFRRGMKETFCMSAMKCYRSNAYTITTSSRIAKKNHVGIADIPATAKSVTKDSTYDAFNREAKERKLAWPIPSNPPNTFV
uniref:Probable G-protein coupled receptor 19 n=1 Tax=Malurus cyaneus samueli TaxID=2593467 RepID=A0A8C5UF12_9PASS